MSRAVVIGCVWLTVVLTCGLAGIWTGDERWAATAVLVSFAAVPVLLALPFVLDPTKRGD